MSIIKDKYEWRRRVRQRRQKNSLYIATICNVLFFSAFIYDFLFIGFSVDSISPIICVTLGITAISSLFIFVYFDS